MLDLHLGQICYPLEIKLLLLLLSSLLSLLSLFLSSLLLHASFLMMWFMFYLVSALLPKDKRLACEKVKYPNHDSFSHDEAHRKF